MERIIYLDDTTSTNDYLLKNADLYGNEEMVIAVADYQSQGHGMGINTWESEKGANLLFSILVHPQWMEAGVQFLASMAEAVAIREVLSQYADGITIKWPNDIYWNDRKISGTRIDCNIKGLEMTDMVIGTGININQEVFVSDAPNPVSLCQITGRKHDCRKILDQIIKRFVYYYEVAKDEWESYDCDTIMEEYHKYLYRKGEFHFYEDENGVFEGRILDAHPNGILNIERRSGNISQYEYKEVKFIIP